MVLPAPQCPLDVVEPGALAYHFVSKRGIVGQGEESHHKYYVKNVEERSEGFLHRKQHWRFSGKAGEQEGGMGGV